MDGLREYQKECIDIINRKGNGRWLVQMATGLGKGYILPHIKYHGRTLFVAHRIKLIEQNSEEFKDYGVEHGKQTANNEKYIFTTTQTLRSRLSKFHPDEFDTIIIDECHRYAQNEFEETVNYFNPKRIIGFTATPNRSDGRGLSCLFDDIIYEKDIVFGIKNGYLAPIHCERINIKYDLSDVNVRNGDYVVKGLAKAVNVESANKAIAKVFESAPKPALIFAVDIDHAENLARECGIDVAHSKKTTKHNEEVIEKFKQGKSNGLVSIEMFTEGINLNNAISLIMARPTQSALLYIQIVGRIVRLCEGKDKAYLYDCVGVTGRHDLCSAPTLLGLDTDTMSAGAQAELIGDLVDQLPELIKEGSNNPESWIKNRQTVDLFAKRNKLTTYGLNFIKHPDGSLICSLPENKWVGMSKINHLGQARMIGSKGILFPLKEPQQVINDILKSLNEHAKDQQVLWHIKRTYNWGRKEATAKQKLYIQRLLQRTKYSNFNTERLSRMDAATIISRIKLDK